MIKRTTPHSLRTIELEYDESKPESEYEKELLRAYVVLHDRAEELLKQKKKLVYEFGELDEQVITAQKTFAPIDETIERIHDEAKVLAEKIKDESGINDLEVRMSEYSNGAINDYHRQTLDPLEESCKRTEEEYAKYEEDLEKFDDDFDIYTNETRKPLYQENNGCSLDLCSYDDDEQAFRGVLDELSSTYKVQSKSIAKYNDLMSLIPLLMTVGTIPGACSPAFMIKRVFSTVAYPKVLPQERPLFPKALIT
jgi:hypothetical protein